LISLKGYNPLSCIDLRRNITLRFLSILQKKALISIDLLIPLSEYLILQLKYNNF